MSISGVGYIATQCKIIISRLPADSIVFIALSISDNSLNPVERTMGLLSLAT